MGEPSSQQYSVNDFVDLLKLEEIIEESSNTVIEQGFGKADNTNVLFNSGSEELTNPTLFNSDQQNAYKEEGNQDFDSS